MNNKIMSFIKKQWLLVWCFITAISLLSLIASAEYELTTNSMKKVVRSTSDQGKMFSSNVLVENGSTSYFPNYKSKLPDNEKLTGTYDIDVYLWNHSLSNIYKFYPSGIDYKIKLSFTHTNGTALTELTAGRSVSLFKGNDATPLLTLNSLTTVMSDKQTLGDNTSQAAEDHYYLKFSGNWDLENDSDICVKMEAIPDNGGITTKYQDLSPISAVIGLKKTLDLGSSGWEAYLAEQRIGNPAFPKNGNYTWQLNGGTAGSYSEFLSALENADFSSEVTVTVAAANGTTNSDDNNIGTYSIARNGTEGSYTYTYTKTDVSIGDFDAYNLVVTGSGKAKITIMWDTRYLECNKNFYNGKIYSFVSGEIEPPVTTNNIITLIINADTSTNENGNRNRYDIQFYKKGTEPANWSYLPTHESTLSDTVWLSVKVEQQ